MMTCEVTTSTQIQWKWRTESENSHNVSWDIGCYRMSGHVINVVLERVLKSFFISLQTHTKTCNISFNNCWLLCCIESQKHENLPFDVSDVSDARRDLSLQKETYVFVTFRAKCLKTRRNKNNFLAMLWTYSSYRDISELNHFHYCCFNHILYSNTIKNLDSLT